MSFLVVRSHNPFLNQNLKCVRQSVPARPKNAKILRFVQPLPFRRPRPNDGALRVVPGFEAHRPG